MPITVQHEFTSVGEVTERLLAFRSRKASGSNDFTNAALHRLPGRGISFLIELFNTSLRYSYFPRKWHTETAILIPKLE